MPYPRLRFGLVWRTPRHPFQPRRSGLALTTMRSDHSPASPRTLGGAIPAPPIDTAMHRYDLSMKTRPRPDRCRGERWPTRLA